MDWMLLLLLLSTGMLALNQKQLKMIPSFSIPQSCLAGQMFAFSEAGEKTEQPTPKKLSESKKKGQVAKSQDLNAAIILLVSIILMSLIANRSIEKICEFLYASFTEYIHYNLNDSMMRSLFGIYIYNFFRITGMTFIIVMVMGVTANLVQSGFLFSLEPLKPKLNKLNPIEGFKNLFSKRALFNLVKTLLKFILIGVIAFDFVRDNIDKILAASGVGIFGLFSFVKSIIFQLAVRVIAILLLLGILDFIFQKYDHKKRLRMTKHEVKEEWKQSEGDPMIRSKRKQKQREISMNRMMAAVSDSTVVVTNPTHLAIALRYEETVDEVPIVVGKGADHVAGKIREAAKENKIPIIENKPLAQVLYKQVDLGEEVPPSLYQAVAEILAIVMKIKKRRI